MRWIVVLNRTQSDIYEYSVDRGLTLVKTSTNPLGRLKNSLMQTDRPGLSRAKYMTASPHSLGASKDPHEEAADQFAREVAKALIHDLKKDHELQVKVVAESKMLGKIRSFFEEATLRDRMEWVEKDLAHIPQSKWPELIGLEKRSHAEGISSRFPV